MLFGYHFYSMNGKPVAAYTKLVKTPVAWSQISTLKICRSSIWWNLVLLLMIFEEVKIFQREVSIFIYDIVVWF